MQYILLLMILLLPVTASARSPFGQAPGGQASESGLPDDPAKLQEMVRKLQEEAGKPKISVPVENPQGRLIGIINGRRIYEGDLRNPEQFSPSTPTPATSGTTPPTPAPETKPSVKVSPGKEVIRISDLAPAAKEPKAPAPKKHQEPRPAPAPKAKKPEPPKAPVPTEPKPENEPAKAPEAGTKAQKKQEEGFDEEKARQDELRRSHTKKPRETAEKKDAENKNVTATAKPAPKKDVSAPESAYFRAGKKAKVMGTAAFRNECEGRFWPKKGDMVQVKPTKAVNVYGYTMDRPECAGGLAYDVGQGFMCGECFDVLSMTSKLPRFEVKQ